MKEYIEDFWTGVTSMWPVIALTIVIVAVAVLLERRHTR